MRKLVMAIHLVGCICLLSSGASAESYGLKKLKHVVASDYYNQRPEIQDAMVYELLFDFDGVPAYPLEARAAGYAAYYGELMAATPVNHRYYKQFAADYRYWSDEAERLTALAIKRAR